MKDISINTINHVELKESSRKWVIIILTLIIVEVCLLGCIYFKQKTKAQQLLNEIHTLESFIETQQPILERKSQLKKEHESLINKKEHLIGNTQLPKILLKKISKSIPYECCISDIIFKKDIITIKGLSKTWIALNNFFDALSKIDTLGSIHLKSSMKDAKHLNFEIEFSKAKKAKLAH